MDGSSSDLVLDLKVAEEKRPPSGWQNPLNHLPSSENFLPSVRDAAVSVIQYSVQPKILLTAGYCVSFAALGLILASLGPVLLDLGKQTNSTLAEIGYVFAARSIGYLVGSAIGGPMFDRLPGNIILTVALLLTGFGTALIPLVTSIWLLGAIVSIQGLSMGLLDTGGNVMLIWLHGKSVGPYMQAMHFSFALGAFFSPIIIHSFLDNHKTEESYDKIQYDGRAIRYSFWIMAACFVPVAIYLLFFKSPTRQTNEEVEENENPVIPIATGQEDSDGMNDVTLDEEYDAMQKGETTLKVNTGSDVLFYGLTGRELTIVFLTFTLLGIYVGPEVAAGGFLDSYAILTGLMDKGDAALLVSMFWGSLCLGRLIAVPLSIMFKPATMMFINTIGCIFATFLYAIFPENVTMLWLSTFCYGLAMSSIFPFTISLTEEYMRVTGKAASLFVVGASLGEMIVPLLVAYLLSHVSPYCLFVVLLVCSVLTFVVFLLMVWKGTQGQREIQAAAPGLQMVEQMQHEESLEDLLQEDEERS